MTDERKIEIQNMVENFAGEIEGMEVDELKYTKLLLEKRSAKNKKDVASIEIDLPI